MSRIRTPPRKPRSNLRSPPRLSHFARGMKSRSACPAASLEATPAASATTLEKEDAMTKPPEPNGVEPSRYEDDIQREQLGPRGVPGAPDPARMTPQREKKTPKQGDPG